MTRCCGTCGRHRPLCREPAGTPRGGRHLVPVPQVRPEAARRPERATSLGLCPRPCSLHFRPAQGLERGGHANGRSRVSGAPGACGAAAPPPRVTLAKGRLAFRMRPEQVTWPSPAAARGRSWGDTGPLSRHGPSPQTRHFLTNSGFSETRHSAYFDVSWAFSLDHEDAASSQGRAVRVRPAAVSRDRVLPGRVQVAAPPPLAPCPAEGRCSRGLVPVVLPLLCLGSSGLALGRPQQFFVSAASTPRSFVHLFCPRLPDPSWKSAGRAPVVRVASGIALEIIIEAPWAPTSPVLSVGFRVERPRQKLVSTRVK